MPRRTVIKLVIMVLVSLGVIIACTVIDRAESARLLAADSPGIPGSRLFAGFIVYPLLCAAVGLVCGSDKRRLYIFPAIPPLAMGMALAGGLVIVIIYAAISYAFFGISQSGPSKKSGGPS